MNVTDRRDGIIKILNDSTEPVSAKKLAEKFNVSRQIIVQDMTVIRALGVDVIPTNRGYVIQKSEVCSREFKVRHDSERVREELEIIADCGGKVTNVSISHRVYGRISAQMSISSRQDVSEYIARLESSRSDILGQATSGYHYHMVEAASEERLDLIEKRLEEAGFLVPLLPWESQQKEKCNDD